MKNTKGNKDERIPKGRYVQWSSQGRGVPKPKIGRIVAYIPKHEKALGFVPGRLTGAIDRSVKNFKERSQINRYMIEVFKDQEGKDIKPVLYCTRATMVREIEKPSGW